MEKTNHVKFEYEVQNIVVTGSFQKMETEKIDLMSICRVHPSAEYNPERFPGLILRFQNPKGTILLFSTGKFVLTGLKKEEDKKPIIKSLMTILKKAKINASDPESSIKNVVASGRINDNEGKEITIDLNMAAVVMEYTMYEPEVFPGLIYRHKTDEYKAVFLIFSTGKVVCAGLNKPQFLDDAFTKLQHKLKEYNLFSNLEPLETFDDLAFI